MSKTILQSLFLIITLAFSSCAIVNDVHFNKDFSGTYTMELDYSGIVDMVQSFSPDENVEEDVLSGALGESNRAEMIEKMNASPGISNATWEVTGESVQSLSFDFEDIESLNQFIRTAEKEAMDQADSEDMLDGVGFPVDAGLLPEFHRDGKTITYGGGLPDGSMDDLEMDTEFGDAKEMMGMLSQMIDYSLIMSFDRKVKNVVATGMDITSQEKKMIKTRLDIGKMLEESDFSLVVDLK